MVGIVMVTLKIMKFYYINNLNAQPTLSDFHSNQSFVKSDISNSEIQFCLSLRCMI